jgi:hypothetical protein
VRPRRAAAVLAATALLLAGCASPQTGGPGARQRSTGSASAAAPAPSSPGHTGGHGTGQTTRPPAPLRPGERLVTVRLPAPYTPKAPAAPGTDDYRCFLLDPGITARSMVTGIDVLPGNPEVVHHVILFRVPPDAVTRAEAIDRAQPGQGWTCFGGTGIEAQGSGLEDAPWLGAWAPGGGEQVLPDDVGLPVEAGSRIVMQVHYNLRAGHDPDLSAARLRLAPDDGSRKALQTVLLPGPVELPCRAGHTGPLCDRAAAVADVQRRFGAEAGFAADALHLLCGPIRPSATQSCTRTVRQAETVRAVAGHMHLLGRAITVEVNRGKPGARTILDLPVWNFDNQGSRPVQPAVHLSPGDTLTVTCRHDQSLRDQLPALQGVPERYVVWGEGTTDEMCLGIVLVTRP